MATTVVKTIGTGGDYTTLQAWEDACPANLVTADQIWQGQLKNQEMTSASTLLTVSGTTVDATRYLELTTEAGASFRDNASKATNALRYNAANGAAILMTGTGIGVSVAQNYTRISNIQMSSTSTSTSAQPTLYVNSTGNNCDVNNCIIEGYGRNSALKSVAAIKGSGSGQQNRIRNSLVVQRSTDTTAVIAILSNGAEAYNCTFVATAATLAVGINTSALTAVVKNCYIGGVTAVEDGTTACTRTTSYSNASSTGYTVVGFSSSTFESITDGTHDFRLKAGSGLIDVATTDSTYAAVGIIGTTRPQGSGYDVGAWEYVAATGTANGATLTGVSTISGGTATGNTGSNAPGATLTGTSTIAGGTASSLGILVTRAQKNNTGTVMAGETGVIVYIWDATTGALVLKKTGVTLDASGIATITDVLLISGTSYVYDVKLTSGARRCNPKAAA
jgi:hypothetical protein